MHTVSLGLPLGLAMEESVRQEKAFPPSPFSAGLIGVTWCFGGWFYFIKDTSIKQK